jgi:HNH endonuclease
MSGALSYVYGSRLEFDRKNCIWCGRRLIRSGLGVDCSEKFGPRPRSDEHIIPKSIFGRFITNDLCKCCNDYFGAVADHALVQDKDIVEAAKLVGFKETDLWSSFDADQVTPRGRTIRIGYKAGEFRPYPSLKNLNELSLPIIDGKLDEKPLKAFAARLKKKVMGKGLGLSERTSVQAALH